MCVRTIEFLHRNDPDRFPVFSDKKKRRRRRTFAYFEKIKRKENVNLNHRSDTKNCIINRFTQDKQIKMLIYHVLCEQKTEDQTHKKVTKPIRNVENCRRRRATTFLNFWLSIIKKKPPIE